MDFYRKTRGYINIISGICGARRGGVLRCPRRGGGCRSIGLSVEGDGVKIRLSEDALSHTAGRGLSPRSTGHTIGHSDRSEDSPETVPPVVGKGMLSSCTVLNWDCLVVWLCALWATVLPAVYCCWVEVLVVLCCWTWLCCLRTCCCCTCC